MSSQNIRNIAVIAHVDHGKTTLVDAMLKQTKTFRDNQDEMFADRIMDSNDLERERGITILAKVCAIEYQDIHINIIDTPGHADFSGEVERTLGMADGALLIVDAQEGPMPQTRFVLRKALEMNLKVIVVINKIDKQYARVKEVEHKLADLFLELAHHDDHLEFKMLYAVGRNGTVFNELPSDPHQPGNVIPLLDMIKNDIPAPKGDVNAVFKMVVSSLDYDNHLGRIIIGKIHQGTIKLGDRLHLLGDNMSFTADRIMASQGLDRVVVESAGAGQIIAISGVDHATIGHTLSSDKNEAQLPNIIVSEPTMHMTLGPNTSPFAGREGKYSTSRQITERLQKEIENNVSLKVQFLESGRFKISGRGELHLSVLLETMRREGYEMEVGKPEVITHEVDGVKSEPIEELSILVLKEYTGAVNQELGGRQANLIKMEPISEAEVEFIYEIPTRAIIGLRTQLLTQTKGTVIMSSQVSGYQPVGQPLARTRKGVILSAEAGKVSEYGLKALKGRGTSFVTPGVQVYEGMIIGLNAKDEDIEINVCKEKHLTNHRSKTHDGIASMAPDLEMSLERSIEFLNSDELLEITPESLRLRKKYLTETERRRADRPNTRG